jgi:hypothetical protein
VSREGIERGPYQIKTRLEGESYADFEEGDATESYDKSGESESKLPV